MRDSLKHTAVLVGFLAAGAAVVASWPDELDAQPVPATVQMPDNDAGVFFAGPRQLAATQIVAPTGKTKSVTICNPYDTDQNPGLVNVRIGSSRVDAFPINKKNGVILQAGQCVSIPMGSNASSLYVISESATDGGVALGVVFSEGGL
jgi:hypothetical protein